MNSVFDTTVLRASSDIINPEEDAPCSPLPRQQTITVRADLPFFTHPCNDCGDTPIVGLAAIEVDPTGDHDLFWEFCGSCLIAAANDSRYSSITTILAAE